MEIIPMLLKEMDAEAAITCKMLACVPNEKYDWQPHPKSMTIRQLITHIAELPAWVALILSTSELDFSVNAYNPPQINDNDALFAFYEAELAKGRGALENATEEDLLPEWTLRNGDQILSVCSRAEFIRISFSQTVHHRAQLGVFLRLLNIPIPGSYGPSADEMEMYAQASEAGA